MVTTKASRRAEGALHSRGGTIHVSILVGALGSGRCSYVLPGDAHVDVTLPHVDSDVVRREKYQCDLPPLPRQTDTNGRRIAI